MTKHWLINQVEDGSHTTYVVVLGQKTKDTFFTERSATDYVARHREDGQKVFLVEPDGYRFDITRKFTK